MLVEADKVEVQVFNAVFFQKVLTEQARQIKRSVFAKCVQLQLLVQSRVAAHGRVVASVSAEVQACLLADERLVVGSEGVGGPAERVGDARAGRAHVAVVAVEFTVLNFYELVLLSVLVLVLM
jgi:hypothetical protein